LETVLHSCAKSGNFNILGCIVSKVGRGGLQVALNRQDRHAQNGWPPLSVACYYGHEKVVEALLKYNARIDVFDEVREFLTFRKTVRNGKFGHSRHHFQKLKCFHHGLGCTERLMD
uniref:ANK_REP_REGION domain-containing protein n=1 Tax=Soboliphyme baturini TaxID=241478 RepID=A0A183J372_9BILA